MEPETVFFKILHWTRKILFRKSFWNSFRQVLKKRIQRPKIIIQNYIEKEFFLKIYICTRSYDKFAVFFRYNRKTFVPLLEMIW